MRVRLIFAVFALLALAAGARAQDCSGPNAAALRSVVMVCPPNVAVGAGRAMPAACDVKQSTPLCPAGVASPILTDITGRWYAADGTFQIDVDDSGAFSGVETVKGSSGSIVLGDFDATSRTLTLGVESGGARILATLTLSADENQLTGGWQTSDGRSGTWTLYRTPQTQAQAQQAQAQASTPPAPANPDAPPPQASVASATCRGSGWTVSPMSGASLNETQTSVGGAPCRVDITTHLPQASVAIVSPPSHGVLTQTGPLALLYQPSPGFQGTDQYAFHYCGANASGLSGCATLNYTVTVEQAAPPPTNPALAPPAAALPSAGAAAVCHTAAWQANATQGVGANVTQTSIGGAACHVTGVSVQPTAWWAAGSPPAHGTFALTGRLSFVYTPNPGYFGTDAYSIRFCDTLPSGQPGCATINYQVTIEQAGSPLPAAALPPTSAPAAAVSISTPPVVSATTRPGCYAHGWHTHPEDQDALTIGQTSVGGQPCTDPITSSGDATAAWLSIATPPNHGTLTQTGQLKLVYQPTPGYRGPDGYVFKDCATNNVGRTGCATITYDVSDQ